MLYLKLRIAINYIWYVRVIPSGMKGNCVEIKNLIFSG
jgi:hypothetical protein